MAGKVRVHELAKELGVTVKQLLLWLSEEGEFAKSGSSTLPAPVARKVREAHAGPSDVQTLGEGEEADAVKQLKPKSQSELQGPNHRVGQLSKREGEPPYQFACQAGRALAHHCDYLNGRVDRGLCGIEGVSLLSSDQSPTVICPACQERLPRYQASWWRDQYLAIALELEQLRQRYARVEEQIRSRRDPGPPQKIAAPKQGAQKTSSKGVTGGKARPRKTGPANVDRRARPITQYCSGCKSQKLITGFDIGRGLCAECRSRVRPSKAASSAAQAKKAPAGPKTWKCPNCLKRVEVDKKSILVPHRNAKGQRCAGSGYQLPERSVDALDYRVAGSFEGGRR
ncbi:hypothetical protein EUA02_05720 [Mycobacterium paragordonae]|nr:hypothetical protein EUA02_05720 [Mycobacterium paragordonae]TDL09269.1 hypothetical protein EUA05_06670 [Mycobacterium paragordonae]